MPEYYEIKIKDHPDPNWSEWFAGLKIAHLDGDETLLSGSLPIRVHFTACWREYAISI